MISLPSVNASRGRARVGVVVPVSNTNLEPDLGMMRPDGVSVHIMRAGGYDIDAVPDSDQMRNFALASLDEVIEALVAAKPDLIVYGCTSATLAHDLAFDREFTERVASMAGVPAITAAGAVVESLKDLGVNKIAFSSPYVEQLNLEAIEFLNQSGFEVVSSAYVGENLGNHEQGALTPERIYKLGISANSEEAEALLLSCTDMRAVEVISALEETLGKPVVTSNQALQYITNKRLALGSKPGFGQLLNRL
ncbi:MAG: maleate isomerase [Gammaproteobacteria bacterium]|jgi:maleate isomerase